MIPVYDSEYYNVSDNYRKLRCGINLGTFIGSHVFDNSISTGEDGNLLSGIEIFFITYANDKVNNNTFVWRYNK